MDNNTKSLIMKEIENKSLMFDKKSRVEYRIRCPFCGDSRNPKDAHCYIKCDYANVDEGIKWHCFLCNRGSSRNVYKLLKALNADSAVLDAARSNIDNRVKMIKESNIDVITNNPVMNSPQVRFINNRLGEGFTFEDFAKFRIIWNMNDVAKYITDPRKLNSIPNNVNRINFISDNKSMILSRSFVEDAKESQWLKFTLFPNDRAFYIIQTTINLFTSEPIHLNIAEGILDILSAYKNFNPGSNSVFIAALGSDYINALQYLIMKGFVGKNVNVSIYIDHNIDEDALMRGLKAYRWMFDQIHVYKNIKYKDIGVKVENIKLKEIR